jgi:hypothetical protein
MFPLAQSLTHRVMTSGGTDEYGDPIPPTWAEAEIAVYGWGPASMTEPPEAGRAEVAWTIDIYAPSSWSPAPADHILLDGAEFEVVGYPEVWDRGPFGFTPGAVVHCRRVEG